MKQSTPKKRNNKSLLVYAFFMVALGIYFIGEAREGKLVVTSRPSGARVYLNKKDYGKTPVDVSVKRGEYQIEVVLAGYENVSRKILIEAGKTASLDLDLQIGK